MKRDYLKGNVGYPFITITLTKGSPDGSDFSLTWRSKDGRPDYFTSLSHKRYVDKANVTEINLAYAPPFGEDPSTVEQAIVRSYGMCTFQYGTEGRKSKVYRGVIYDYSVSFNNGSLLYRLSLISRVVAYNFKMVQESVVIENPNAPGSKLSGRIGPKIGTPGRGGTDTTQLAVLGWMHNIVEYYTEDSYEFDEDGSDRNFKVPKQDISIVGMSPIEGIIYVAKSLVDKEDPKKYFYKVEVDESGSSGKPKVYLRRSANSASKRLSFDWGTKDTDVINFSPSYKGVYAIFKHRGDYAGEETPELDTMSTLATNSSGEVVGLTYNVPNATNDIKGRLEQVPWDEESLNLAVIRDINWYEELSNYSYQASLTVLGTVDTVELGRTVIEINPYINGRLYTIFAGLYVVIGVTDKIDNSGYTTSYDLYKMPMVQKGEDGKYYVQSSDGTLEEVYDHVPGSLLGDSKTQTPETDTNPGNDKYVKLSTSQQKIGAKLYEEFNKNCSASLYDLYKMTAAFMGNIWQESRYDSKAVGGSTSSTVRDNYTNKIDNRDDNVSLTLFRDDETAYGLCQWLYSVRKAALWNYVKGLKGKAWGRDIDKYHSEYSIGNPDRQVEFILKELTGETGYSDYKSVFSSITRALSVKEACNIVFRNYEAAGDSTFNVRYTAALNAFKSMVYALDESTRYSIIKTAKERNDDFSLVGGLELPATKSSGRRSDGREYY